MAESTDPAARRAAILASLETIPGLPAAAVEVLHLIDNPEAGVAEVMAVVEQDPGLTADVLKLANSAYFAGPHTITTIRQAGVVFGLARVQQIVLASAAFPVVRRPVRGYDLPAGALAEHAAATGVAAERLGRALGYIPPQYTFTAGLLHNIGKLALGSFLEVDARPLLALAAREQIPFPEAERRMLGIDHAEAGAILLGNWGLPAAIVEVVRWHHEPDAASAHGVVDLVHLADLIAIGCGRGVGLDGLQFTPAPGALARLGVTTALLDQVALASVADLDALRPLWQGER